MSDPLIAAVEAQLAEHAASRTDEAFERLDLVAFLAEPPPESDWLLDGLLEVGELCWLAGRGKVGKSMVALGLVSAVLGGGGTFLGRPVGVVDWVLYIDAENRAPTVRRRVHLLGMTPEVAARIDYRSARGVDLGSPAGADGLRRLIDREGRGLVVLDSLVGLHRADEDKAGEVRRFVDTLRTVFEPRGITAVGLAHENRTGNLRGSLDWRNAADRVLEMVKGDDGVREVRVGDVRDGSDDEPAARVRFVAETDQVGRRRLLLEPVEGAPIRAVRSKAEQVADQVVLLLRGDPTLTRARTAAAVGYSADHGTFRKAWRLASEVLAGDGAGNAPADAQGAGAGRHSP